jgi:lysophospholipase L1-like esterase
MEWYEAEVSQMEKKRASEPLPADPVAFYGSSTIRLWENLAEDMGSRRALNLGFGGSTLEACVYFFERLVTPVKPCSLVVYAGDNDLGDGRHPDQVHAFFCALAQKVKRDLEGRAFGFVSIKPSPARFAIVDKIRQTNQLIKDEIEAGTYGYYIDLFDAMLAPDGGPRRDLFGEDGLHMNRDGYKLWLSLLAPFRNRIFTEDCHRT